MGGGPPPGGPGGFGGGMMGRPAGGGMFGRGNYGSELLIVQWTPTAPPVRKTAAPAPEINTALNK